MSVEWDIEELAYRTMGCGEEEAEDKINEGDIDEELYSQYGVDFCVYCEIVKDLLPFTPKIQGVFGNHFHAFVDNEKQRAIVKQEAI